MENKQLFLDILESVDREGITDLINFLESSDFFTAPASTKYHYNFEGGLCAHSLNVYFNLYELAEQYKVRGIEIPMDSIIICGLLHDISKTNFYELYTQNKKVYSENGSKYDELGRYDWQSVYAYKTKDISQRFVAVEHCVNSVFIIEDFIKLTLEERTAIACHHSAFNNRSDATELSEVYSRSPLALFTHLADLQATFIDESPYLNKIDN